jgi:hypothetical protein
MRCSDDNFYVVKFRNNPQHTRVLANEIIAASLAELVGLPVPHTEVIQVDSSLIQDTPELTIQLATSTVLCEAGLQSGSRYAVDPLAGRILDDFPNELLSRVRNVDTFAGMLAFDKWTGNVDSRQATFWRRGCEKKYTATFIDQGHCFNIGEWTFPDKPLKGVYPTNEVYLGVRSWESFEPWLSRIENMDTSNILMLGNRIPSAWSVKRNAVSMLLQALTDRRSIVRQLILDFRCCHANPFPNWRGPSRNVRDE